MSGIADVARVAGVSKSTASRALSGSGYVSEDTRRRVADAAASLGYVPSTSAVSLATGRTRTVGVMMPTVTRWFFAEVLEGIQHSLLQHGLDLTLYTAGPDRASHDIVYRDFLSQRRFDGLIAVGLDPVDRDVDMMRSLERPVVTVASGDIAGVDVAIDDEYAVRRATEHLIDLGHRSIVFLGGPRAHWAHVDELRFRGYLRTMESAGLGAHAHHVTCPVTLPGGFEAAVDLLSYPEQRPTGIVAVCDEVAIGAIIAARRLGISVPAELSVIGIDDHEYAEMFSLTTLAQNPRQQGALAVDLLAQRIADPTIVGGVKPLRARLVSRHSTARVREG
ncbi:transcriptional regulator [Microbacterium mangrovi]|uniref:Transcriptional regulator n=1 Tax=Microbacterium mangrovi TaxID=1348253 RepID=A0A0B2ABF8_9MICO|nr:LacI family DNA-binding transcriptional regulator [Microbacterium mangrovi]KHK98927.1 transcriptional regulator [Microbacterium mangrovi]